MTDHGLAVLQHDLASCETSLRAHIEACETGTPALAALTAAAVTDERAQAVLVLRHVLPLTRALEHWITSRAVRTSLAATQTGASQ